MTICFSRIYKYLVRKYPITNYILTYSEEFGDEENIDEEEDEGKLNEIAVFIIRLYNQYTNLYVFFQMRKKTNE